MFALLQKKILAFVGTIWILLLAFIFLQLSQSTQTNIIPTPTIQPIPTAISIQTLITYTPPNNTYSIKLPANWQKEENTIASDPVTVFVFTNQSNQYRFTISPPGQIDPEGEEDKIREQRKVVYTGKTFTQTVWENSSGPFYIVAIPTDVDATPYYFSMQLPPQHADSYMQLFGQLIASFKQQ